MKKTWLPIIISLVLVLGLTVAFNYFSPFLAEWFKSKTYGTSSCLTSTIKEGDDIYDIAKLYRDGNGTVAVKVRATSLGDAYGSLGSGVCVASSGYVTNIDDGAGNKFVASKGGYIATNYHVIEYQYDDSFSDVQVSIMTEEEKTYSCEILWANKDLDLALLYCDSTEANLNYIAMADRMLFCENGEEKFDYEQIFTIGTPLEIENLNRLTVGNIGSNDLHTMYTAETVSGKTVLSNVYYDVLDITAGISPGNSGGGCFDSKGYLIGLNTLGSNADVTGGNQMNGVVSIYPIMKILDRIIQNNEGGTTNSVYTLDHAKIGIEGMDALEVAYAKSLYYYLDGKFYSQTNPVFNFNQEGYYIVTNNSTSLLSQLPATSYITKCSLNGKDYMIVDRNDLIYFLLGVKNGDTISVQYVYLGTTRTLNNVVL